LTKGRELSKSIVIVGLGISIVIAFSGALYIDGSNLTPPTYASSTIDGIECNTTEYAVFHIHAHLDIFKDGKPISVPSQIGINTDAGCLYWLHTHDDSGVIHIESPLEREFTLGNFFDIWGESFNNTHLFDEEVTNNTLSVYVNGNKVPTDMDYRSINLNAHDEIAIVYGVMPSDRIPSNYEFARGL
jgi:hypothetical protein